MIRRARPYLGTFVEIGIDADAAMTDDHCEQAINSAFDQFSHIDKLLSFHRHDSELSIINANPGMWYVVSRHCRRVLTLAKLMGKATGEVFNVTVGGEVVNVGALPNLVSHRFLPRGTSDDIELRGNAVRLGRPVLITLDGIAKGYAVDLAVAALKRKGIDHGWVNAGGDLRVFGRSTLAVHQVQKKGQLSQPLSISNAAVASSQLRTRPSTSFPGLIILPQSLKLDLGQANATITVKTRFAWRADALTKVAAGTAAIMRQKFIQQLKGELLEFANGQF